MGNTHARPDAGVNALMEELEGVTLDVSDEYSTTGLSGCGVCSLFCTLTGQYWLCLTCMLSVLTYLLVLFNGDWERECDLPLKVWCVVCVSSMVAIRLFNIIVDIIFLSLVNSMNADAICCGCGKEMWLGVLAAIDSLLWMFRLGWLAYGASLLWIAPACNKTTVSWATIVWWLDASECIFYFGCLASYFCLPWIVRALLRNVIPVQGEERRPTPIDVVSRLEKIPYSELLERFKLQAPQSPSRPRPPSVPTGTTEQISLVPPARTQPADTSSETQTLLPSSYQPSRPNKSNGASTHSPAQRADKNAIYSNEGDSEEFDLDSLNSSCPICMQNFSSSDQVTPLPCDSRHFFHNECIAQWLSGSHLCPTCRRSVVGFFTDDPSAADTGVNQSIGAVNRGPPVVVEMENMGLEESSTARLLSSTEPEAIDANQV